MFNDKVLNRRKSVIYMIKQLKPYTIKMIFSVICGILKELSIIAAVGICAYMTALVIKGSSLGSFHWILLLISLVILRALTTYLESYLSHDVAYHALVDYRVKLYDRFITLCPDIILKQRSGQVATTLMNDVEQLEWFYGHTVGQITGVIVICFGLVGFMAYIHWILALVLLISIIIISFIPSLMEGKADIQGLECRYRLGEANSVTLEGINGMNEILTLNWQKKYKQKNRDFMQKLTDIQVLYAKRMGIEGGLLQGAAGICSVIINLIGIYLTLKGQIEVEWYAVIGTTVWLAFNPVLSICTLARSFGNVFAASARVTKILESEPVVYDHGKFENAEKLEPYISFDNVEFSYSEDGPSVLENISFDIKSGETVALVGESGAGKTTCISLLNRLWDVKSGSIKIGNQDIRSLSLYDLHNLISVVLQDVYLFNSSIAENIRLGKPLSSDAELISAAKMAKIHDFISSLPQGYNTITGERGVQMSGGQRQRVALARALLKDSPILVLDEAVSNLDTKTDMEIQETIRNLSHKKTILMAAHRLSTIIEADKIIVLRKGQIVQVGSHQQLINENGYYRELIKAQLSYSSQ